MPTALVTGSSGYIGNKLVSRLVSLGWSVGAPVRAGAGKKSYDYLCDVFYYTDPVAELQPYIVQLKPDVIFHLAASYHFDPSPQEIEQIVHANVLLPAIIADAASKSGSCGFINTSSYWQRWDNSDYYPRNLYAASKEAAESMITFYDKCTNLKTVTLELFDVYGIDDRRIKLLNQLRDSIRNSSVLDMTEGNQFLNLVHVDDVVDAYILVATKIMNLDSLNDKYSLPGELYKITELIELLKKIQGNADFARFGKLSYRINESFTPISPLEILPDWSPKKNLLDDYLLLI